MSDLQTLLGSAGSQDISLPISTLESLFGAAGSQDISIPLNTLEGLFPSTLSLDLTIPDVTGGAVPNFDVDLGQTCWRCSAVSLRFHRICRACWELTRRST